MNEVEKERGPCKDGALIVIISKLSRDTAEEESKTGPEPGLSYHDIRM